MRRFIVPIAVIAAAVVSFLIWFNLPLLIGLAAFGLGMIMIPLNNRIGTTLPLGCISVGLLLFLMLLGALFWMVGMAVR